MRNLFLISSLIFILNFTSLKADSHQWWIKGKFYESIKDNLLVATTNIYDPKFKKSVIIIFENNKNRSWGLVVNKPLGSIPLEKLIDISKYPIVLEKNLFKEKIPVYWGGPVEKQRIFILHSKDYQNQNTKKYDHFFMTSDPETLIKIAENEGPKEKLIIIGISSWGEGQLEGEMERDDWRLSEINKELIFKLDNKIKWESAFDNGFLKL